MNYQRKFDFFIKELNKNKSNITKVFFSIFISLLIFSSVLILKNSIEKQIDKNSRVLLGGDIELSSKNKAISSDFLNKLKDSFIVTEVVEFTSIIRTNKDKSQTTRFKAVDNLYPLIGEIKVFPSDSLKILQTEPDSILIDETTKNNLDLKLGDKIKIQGISFKIIGIIESLPDISGFFLFGDLALINTSSLEGLKINNLGSFLNFKYKMVRKDNNRKLLSNLDENQNTVIKFPKDVSQNLKKIIENFIYFLSIISASSILISGIGLKNSLFSFLSDNQFKIAIYKSLGLSSRNIKNLYYLQTLVMLTFCSICTYILGLLIISFLDYSILNFLNFELNVKFNIYEFLIIQFFSIVIFFIFAKPVLDSIDQIKVVDLFRNSRSHLSLNYTKKSVLEITIFSTIFIFSFCFLNTKPQQTAIFFIFFTIISLFYYFFSKFYIFILNKITNDKNLFVKIGVKNLKSFSSLNSIVIMTMGLGTTILFFLGFLSSNINKELSSAIPENAPNYFFLGIQESELNLFKEKIGEIDNEAKQIIVPMISARIERINNKKPREFINDKNKSFWFINGERRISWTKYPPVNNPVVKGKWWDDDNNNYLKLSLDSKVADDLNLKIGDSMTFNIYGNSVSGIIKNFRKVDYKDLNVNFAILFNPEYASKIPHEFISTVKFKNEDLVNLSNLLIELPNITYVKLSEYINKTKTFLNQLFTVSMLISGIVILIGLIVISNAVSVIGDLKIYQNLVLTILGFGKFNIIILVIFETLILFIPTIFSSLLFSLIISKFFIMNFLSMNWYFSMYVPLIISSLFLLSLFLTLLLSNRKYLKLNVYSLLRNG